MVVAKSLPLDQARRAYQAVNGLFVRRQDEALEIEVLPSVLNHDGQAPATPFGILEEDSCIGIPKETVVMAYLHAKGIFFENKDNEAGDQQVAFDATTVMLLFDPENITPANFRKKRLLRIQESGPGNAGETLQLAVNRERLFLDSILTSPLHRQSKSPTLWYHRAWVLENFMVEKALEAKEELAAFVHAELTAVCASGERHPKNYYAWQYARKLWSLVCARCEPSLAWRGPLQDLACACVTQVVEWCRKRPGDISGWAFLAYMLPSIESVSYRTMVVSQALDYALNINWQGESLWWFIRTMLAADTISDDRDALISKMNQNQNGESTITQALDWTKRSMAAMPKS